MANKFTWHEKFTRVLEKMPEDTRGAFALAIIAYGTDGTEPALEFPYDAIFESIREDIDNSVKARSNGSVGGRAFSRKAETSKETTECDEKTGVSDDETTPLETPLETPCNPPCENTQAKPYQSIPIHTNPNQVTPKPPSDDSTEAVKFAIDAIDVFNEITGKSVQAPEGEVMLRLQRLNDRGYSLDDVRKVVKAKNRQWKDDRKMKAYIRPETLFGQKFDSYLNENPKEDKNDELICDYGGIF